MAESAAQWASDIYKKGRARAEHVLATIEGECFAHARQGYPVPAHLREKRQALKEALSANTMTPEPALPVAPPVAEPEEKTNDTEFTARVCTKYLNLKSNAENRGKEFDLSFADVRKLLSVKRCQYTGVALTDSAGTESISTDRTIDRLDPAKGYVSGNVFAVSFEANKVKNVFLEHPGTSVDIDYAINLMVSLKSKGFK